MENDTVEKNVKRIIILVTIKRKKKQKSRKVDKAENTKKDRGNIIKIFQKMKKFLKEVMVTIEIKI